MTSSQDQIRHRQGTEQQAPPGPAQPASSAIRSRERLGTGGHVAGPAAWWLPTVKKRETAEAVVGSQPEHFAANNTRRHQR